MMLIFVTPIPLDLQDRFLAAESPLTPVRGPGNRGPAVKSVEAAFSYGCNS